METAIEIIGDIVGVIAKWIFIGLAYLICSPFLLDKAIYDSRTGKCV